MHEEPSMLWAGAVHIECLPALNSPQSRILSRWQRGLGLKAGLWLWLGNEAL